MHTLTRSTFDAAVMSGKPRLRGLRVTGGTMVGLLAAGHSRQAGKEAEPMGSVSLWRSPMTEASANGPEEPGDALAGASLAARVLNDLNHRTTHWIHFIAYHLADPADDQTRMIRYWTTPFGYEILQPE